jgi:hypothetical protein
MFRPVTRLFALRHPPSTAREDRRTRGVELRAARVRADRDATPVGERRREAKREGHAPYRRARRRSTSHASLARSSAADLSSSSRRANRLTHAECARKTSGAEYGSNSFIPRRVPRPGGSSQDSAGSRAGLAICSTSQTQPTPPLLHSGAQNPINSARERFASLTVLWGANLPQMRPDTALQGPGSGFLAPMMPRKGAALGRLLSESGAVSVPGRVSVSHRYSRPNALSARSRLSWSSDLSACASSLRFRSAGNGAVSSGRSCWNVQPPNKRAAPSTCASVRSSR